MAIAGLREIAIVVDPRTRGKVREVVTDGSTFGVDLEYVELDEPLGTAHALQATTAFLDGAAAVVHGADGIFVPPLRPLVESFHERRLDALLAVHPVDEPNGQAMVVTRGPHVVRVDQSPLTMTQALAMSGICVMGPALLAAVRLTLPAWSGQIEIADALTRLIEDGGHVQARSSTGWWPCTGQAADLLDANRVVLDRLRARSAASAGAQNVRGHVEIHPSASVSTTVIRGPAVIGPGARLSDSHVGPYTSIGAHVVLEGVEVSDSVLLEGAVLKHLSQRVESSVIGMHAHVVRDFVLPHTMRLHVGDDVDVTLA